MMLEDAYYVVPFWVAVLICLRLVFGLYGSIFLASAIFGVAMIFKAQKADAEIWKSLSQNITSIGHRACALNAPENTLAGVREAHRLGVKAIEFDIMLTADDEPIIIHDSSLDRTTDGTGEVASMTWEQIQRVDAASKYTGPGKHDKERVPHLKEMLRECKDHGLKVFLDIKGSRPLVMSKVLTEMTKEFPDLHEWAVVCSFYPQLLVAVKWYLPQFPTILTHRPWVLTFATPDGPERNKELWKRIVAPFADVLLRASLYHFWWYFTGASATFIEKETVSIQELKYWKARGLDVFVWTVNNNDMKTYLKALNLPYITDDCQI